MAREPKTRISTSEDLPFPVGFFNFGGPCMKLSRAFTVLKIPKTNYQRLSVTGESSDLLTQAGPTSSPVSELKAPLLPAWP